MGDGFAPVRRRGLMNEVYDGGMMRSKLQTDPGTLDGEIATEMDGFDSQAHEAKPRPWAGQERRGVTPLHPDAALKDSELRYRRLFETAKDGILSLDGETGIVTDVNPFLVDLLGYSRDEIVGKAFWEFGPFRDAAASRNKFRQLHHVEYLKYDNLPLETKGHEIRNVEFVTNLYLVGERRVVQCNIREITSRILAEDGARKERAEMSMLVVALRQRDAEMQAINRMNDLLQTCTVKDEAYKVISLMAGKLFELRPGAVAIMNPETQSLETVSRWGGEALMAPTFDLQDCWGIRGGKAHEVLAENGGLPCAHFSRQPDGGSYCPPLTVQGETFGLLTLTGRAAAGDGPRPHAHPIAESVGEAIKLSLSNLRLRENLRESKRCVDSLTGLFQQALPRRDPPTRGCTAPCAPVLRCASRCWISTISSD